MTVIQRWTSEHRALLLLLGVSALMLLLGLGSRELWGPETRWANIALQMLQSGDYLDPYLKGSAYYDKPLPSYWLITATAGVLGDLNHWSLRLPSVIAAWLSVWLVYLIGKQLFSQTTGLIAGWMLISTFYFVFWGRVATADILTVCGLLAAVWWYWRSPDDTRFSRYCVFFLLLAVSSLLKGLIGFVLPGLILLPHVLSEQRWKQHVNGRLCAALVIALAVYLIPFALSHLYGAANFGQSGLGLVLRENVVRFFQPFDNLGPIYTYLLYLPVYTLPWAPVWIIALWVALRNWRHIEPNARWLVWGLTLLFVFFTASGSRRSYYVLPLVPFAQLLGAWWVARRLQQRKKTLGRGWKVAFGMSYSLLLLVLGVFYPWSNGGGGVMQFGQDVKAQASAQAPWDDWRMVMIEVDNKLPLYVQNDNQPFYFVSEDQNYPRQGDSAALMAWLDKTSGHHFDLKRTLIFAQHRSGDPLPLGYLSVDHQVVSSQVDNGDRLLRRRETESVAYIPDVGGSL
ncbi:ArnT family glycosyltransferase [Pseudomonas helleri]|uniref:Phospholipid carrier-dependent glycosyltransferase n=1 Tax=Pseudomonas helleri TaxID=1608996 RepID=A0A6L5HPA6_9PSED|nr:glycosyltransferase family 39 protein [Pseudomonas helleri]MQU04221.1 phospholipid carrier-dependent glycosyltransferase [Pseudomonas helleri]